MSNVPPVPKDFGSATPYLIVSDAGAALDFYARAFGATILERLARPDGMVMHATFQIGDSKFMLGSHPGAQPFDPQHFPKVSIYLYVTDADATFAQAVQSGATSLHPVDNKFYGN